MAIRETRVWRETSAEKAETPLAGGAPKTETINTLHAKQRWQQYILSGRLRKLSTPVDYVAAWARALAAAIAAPPAVPLPPNRPLRPIGKPSPIDWKLPFRPRAIA